VTAQNDERRSDRSDSDVGAFLDDIDEIVCAKKTGVDQCDSTDDKQSGYRKDGLLPVETCRPRMARGGSAWPG
jgi:hypothetical protein